MISKIKSAGSAIVEKYKFSRYLLELQQNFQIDKGSNKVAYITYFMFLSVLPLLLVSLTIFDIIFSSNPALRKTILDSTFSSIPVVGPTLESNLSFVQSRGLTLVVTVVILIWASRSGALALQDALSQIFKTNLAARSFVSKQFRAFGALMIIAVGVVVPTFMQTILNGTFVLDAISFILNVGWNIFVVLLLFWILVGKRNAWGYGAVFGGVGLSVIQLISALLLKNSLDNQRPLYGVLAIVLVFMLWISLQIRVLIYSAEINKLQHKANL